MMPNRAAGVLPDIAPLPPFTTPEDILADALPLLDPPSRITVTDAAERFMFVQVAGVWQRYNRRDVPYTVEPADMTQSRRFKAVVFIGPSQSGKTKMLETTALHSVMCEPDPVQIIHMGKTDAEAWVEEKLDPTIQNSPAILERLGKAREDSTMSRKRFKGMRLTIGYPTAQQLSGRTQRKVLLTDYDHMRQRLGAADSPEGSPFQMALQRIKTYMTRGCVLAESTPAFPVTDPTWQPLSSAPHELPPVAGGIAAIYNEGTRGRWYWECPDPDCGEIFEPRFEHLVYDKDLPPAAAGEDAEMACPHCGGLIPHRDKVRLNRAALEGRGGWFHESTTGQPVRIDDPRLRKTDIASYAITGVVAAFANWADLVTQYEGALRKFEDNGDDLDLSVFHYTSLGVPYTPRGDQTDADMALDAIKAKLHPVPRGVAPEWVRFVTASVDVQDSRFPVQFTGWGLDGRRTILDRFDITAAPEDAPRAGDRGIQPARYAEDWAALVGLADRQFPIEGTDFALRPVALAVDFHGSKGVSDNAEKFWRGRRAAGQGAIWFLSRGEGGFTLRDRVWHQVPGRSAGGKKARGVKLLFMATDRLKDTVTAALDKDADAAGAFLVPEWMARDDKGEPFDDHLAEFVAERRGTKGWEPRPGMKRNESLDLSVQAQALAEHKGLARINPEAPPVWAILGQDNPFCIRIAADAPDPVEVEATQRDQGSRTERASWIPKRGNWL